MFSPNTISNFELITLKSFKSNTFLVSFTLQQTFMLLKLIAHSLKSKKKRFISSLFGFEQNIKCLIWLLRDSMTHIAQELEIIVS